jgi:hypothetical protein
MEEVEPTRERERGRFGSVAQQCQEILADIDLAGVRMPGPFAGVGGPQYALGLFFFLDAVVEQLVFGQVQRDLGKPELLAIVVAQRGQ